MRPRGRSRRTASAAAALVVTMLVPSGGAAQDASSPPFRSACDLVDAGTVSGILGDTVTTDEAVASIACTFSKGDNQEVMLQLIPEQTLPLLRLTLPSAAYATVDGQTALVTPGDSNQPAGTVVALDDGVLVVDVTSDAPTDEEAASTSIAQAILSNGPVLAQPPITPGLTPLTYDGSPCDLVTARDLKAALGSRFTIVAHDTSGCTYSGGSGRSQEYVSVGMPKLPISMLRTKRTTDVTIADRPGLLIPKSGTLLVDIGDGRALQLVVGVSPTPKGSAMRKLTQKVEGLAAQAIGRMTPGTASASPATTAICGLLDLAALRSATGIDYTRVSAPSDTVCDYTSTDERTGILVLLSDAASLDAAWSDAGQTFPLPKTPTSVTVDGLPAYDALIGADAAAVAVDLSGTPEGNGKVLGLLLLADPSAPGDPVASALTIAGQAVQTRMGG